MSATTRRTLFAGATAVVLGGGITAGAAASVADLVPLDKDAQLIAIGAEAGPCVAKYERLLLRWWALECGDPGLRACADAMDVPHGRICDLAEQARNISASVPEGWRAKALLIRHLMTVEHGSEDGMHFETLDQELIWSLISDMTGEA